MDKVKQGYGFMGSGRTDTDYCLGASPIVWDEIKSDANWHKDVPPFEYQKFNWGDSWDCVTRAILDSIETQINVRYGESIDWSDRFSAKMSGTVIGQGNTVYNVIESIRKNHGIIEQRLWTNDVSSAGEYYAEIPVNIQGQAKTRLNKYLIQYEWIDPPHIDDLKKALKNCPLCIAVYAYSNPVNGIYPRIEGYSPNHYVLLTDIKQLDNGVEVLNIFDHYQGYEFRQLAIDYIISAVLKIKVTKIMEFKKEVGNPSIYLIQGDKKIMIIDMPTLTALNGQFTEVPSLEQYADGGTLIWTERIIN